MIKLDDFKKYGLNITWTIVDIGYNSEKFKHLLNAQDIINYSIELLENGDRSLDVTLLASANGGNIEEISELIRKLAKNETKNYNIEFKKWRVIYLINYLPKNQKDYIQGLIDIGDIWAMFDFPYDSPHVFQGRNNSITPAEYYTQENFVKLMKSHEIWIENELADLRNCQ